VLPRRREPGEAALAAIATPDRTSIFFCRTDERQAGSWLLDFERLPAPGRNGDAPAIARVDHVALSQPFHFFDEAVLFYRSVLGLEPGQDLELAAPDGLVRSRAVSDAHGRVRFALNVPVLARDSVGAAGPQHVAFACDDVLELARRLRERGMPPVAIPDNWYDDLAARTDLGAERVEELRAHAILYDRDAGGELLHLHTPVVGGRLSFEAVQRIGAYDGYGAANAPVRMAAQRAPAPVAIRR
jgi:4-hydroxyphenylpyruvate dioxygenase